MAGFSVKTYWNDRYGKGGNSGAGSYGRLRDYKLRIINGLIKEYEVGTLVDIGCGDGSVASGIHVDGYTGLDISEQALAVCRKAVKIKNSSFFTIQEFSYEGKVFDMALSMDVIFHLIEEDLFREHIESLFKLAGKLVVVYSSDREDDGTTAKHLKHRKFTSYIGDNIKGWELVRVIPNEFPFNGDQVTQSYSDFFIYGRQQGVCYAGYGDRSEICNG